jgi:hypothetical protein
MPDSDQSVAETIPVDAYGADDGDVAWVPHLTRSKAVAMMASFWGEDFTRLRARRVWMRQATTEERTQRGWHDYGACVLTCERGTPGAVPGWEIHSSV